MDQITPPVNAKPVIVALDLSERSEHCLSHGCEMARKFGQPLVLVHVVHEDVGSTGMYRRHQKTKDTTPIHDIARAMLEERVAAFREAPGGLDRICDVQLVVVDGLPETRIVELAARYDASMVVMCSNNRRGLSHWLFGSVTETVVRRATCPVVVVGQGDGELDPVSVQHPLAPVATAAHGN
jgi:nucleotide-binding universal stress UspA family protein